MALNNLTLKTNKKVAFMGNFTLPWISGMKKKS